MIYCNSTARKSGRSGTVLGVMLRSAELLTGYDSQRIGTVDLHGLVAGVQIWF